MIFHLKETFLWKYFRQRILFHKRALQGQSQLASLWTKKSMEECSLCELACYTNIVAWYEWDHICTTIGINATKCKAQTFIHECFEHLLDCFSKFVFLCNYKLLSQRIHNFHSCFCNSKLYWFKFNFKLRFCCF